MHARMSSPAARPHSAAPRGHLRARWPGTAALLGVVAGTALQLQQRELASVLAHAAALAAGLALLASLVLPRTRSGLRLARAGLGAAALAWGLCGLRALAFEGGALAPQWQGVDLRVTGTIAAMPQARENGLRLRLAVESAHAAGDPGPAVPLPQLIDLSWYAAGWGGESAAPLPAVRAGERWRLTVRLKAPHGARNPHGFDYELWLWEQGVQATGYVRSGARDAPPERLDQTWRYPVEQLRQAVRDAIAARLAPAEADEARRRASGVVAALVTGDQRAIDRADWEVFRTTGVAHLMSISGLHITLFAWIAAAALQWLWRRSARLCLAVPAPHAALVGGVLLAGAYALFSGWGVPAQRTVLMLASVALLRLSGRRWPWPQVWLLACAVVLLADPWALVQPGFWLSFVAVGVLFATDRGAQGPGGKRAAARFLHILREQWIVTLALAPLTLLLFGQVSVVGLLANLLAIPWTTLVLLPAALGGVLWPPLWQLAAWSAELLGLWLQWLAGWPGAQLLLPRAPLWAGLLAVGAGVLLVLRLPWGVRLLALPLALPALAWQPARPEPGQFDLLALDVGQGQAVLVRTAGRSLLYDAGPRYGTSGDAGERVVVPLLQALGERLDQLVLSHGDSDHTGGAAAVLAQQPGARVSGSIDAGHPLQALRLVQPCVAGQRWRWDGVDFEMLHPAPELPPAAGAASRPNARSCVLRVQAQGLAGASAGRAALLAGDIERAQELALVAAGAPLAADLLLVPHHGSRTSSSDTFLDAVRPSVALVQAGWRNRFGHPAAEVRERYRTRGAALVQTAVCGAAGWSSATGQVRCEREAGRRYWHHRVDEGAGRQGADVP